MAEYLKVVAEYTVQGSSVPNNVFFFQLPDGESDEKILSAVDEWIADEWIEEWATIASTLAELTQVTVSKVDLFLQVTEALGTSVIQETGGSLQTTLSAAVSACIYAGTERPKSRGRKFIPGLSEEFITNGLLTPGVLGDLAVLLLAYYTPWTSTQGLLMIPGVISTVTNTFLAFNQTGGYDDIPDYQTRRRPDRGS